MPLAAAILLALIPVLVVAALACWYSPHIRLRHWRRWVSDLPERVERARERDP